MGDGLYQLLLRLNSVASLAASQTTDDLSAFRAAFRFFSQFGFGSRSKDHFTAPFVYVQCFGKRQTVVVIACFDNRVL